MSTVQPPLNPSNAPYLAGTVPAGWDRAITVEEADAGNLLYPVPPYGDTYTGPGVPPAEPPQAQFVKVFDIVNGNPTMGKVTRPDLMADDLIFVLWPIMGVLGILDDIGARPVRVIAHSGNDVTFNFDSTGLDTTNLVLLGVVYTGP